MSNQLVSLLQRWFPQRDACGWVLGTVYHTEGSAYRKPGAHMLFNDAGQHFGLLSGGCLEADLHRMAMRTLDDGCARTQRYDSSDEDELVFQLGLGCGGIVDILLQPVTADSGYLELPELLRGLEACSARESREALHYWQHVPDKGRGDVLCRCEPASTAELPRGRAVLLERENRRWLLTRVAPPPHLLVVGGGIDAQPLVAIAAQLGWDVTLLDPRPANARAEHFPAATRISRDSVQHMDGADWFKTVDAAVVMTHSRPLDAAALRALSNSSLAYCALLGPPHRREEVLAHAGLQCEQLPFELFAPAGLDLGGELPESIALSILAQCHARLHGRDAAAMHRPATQPAAGTSSSHC